MLSSTTKAAKVGHVYIVLMFLIHPNICLENLYIVHLSMFRCMHKKIKVLLLNLDSWNLVGLMQGAMEKSWEMCILML